MTGTAGKLEWSLVSTANNGAYLRDPVSTCPTINDGNWHHVLGAVNRDRAQASVHADGTPAGNRSFAGLGTLDHFKSPTIDSDPTGAYGSATFNLDGLGVWRRA